MGLCHVSITLGTGLESLHAKPANVRRTLLALHMIATKALFDGGFAIRTISHVMLLLPFLECFCALRGQILVFFASHTVMSDHVARCTDRFKASGAKESFTCCRNAVHLRTVGRGTVLKVLGMRADVAVEGGFEKFLECRVAEHSL